MKIAFKEFNLEDVPLYYEWAEKDHVKKIWFLDGYQPKEYILKKIEGNGIEHPFVIMIDDKPVGHIQYWDIHARDIINKDKKDYFTGSPSGTYGIDIFIGEIDYVGKGYGAKILSAFVQLLFDKYGAKKLVVDPSIKNTNAIRCYEKVGFKFSRTGHEPVSGEVAILEMMAPSLHNTNH